MPKILILCPTFDHADTLFAAIGGARAQSFTDWEMAVIGDGAPARTDVIMAAIAEDDRRIAYHPNPKSERYGEVYRDPIVRASSAEFICHLSDDDLWTPDHLATMLTLLQNAEWANQAALRIEDDQTATWLPMNLGTAAAGEAIRARRGMRTGFNYVAYRRDTYLRLPEGWTCAPPEAIASDEFMWAKFFRDPSLVTASAAVTTAIHFHARSKGRVALSPEQRLAALSPWMVRLAEPRLVSKLRRKANVLARMMQIFAVHGAETCNDLDAAFALCGLKPADAAAEPMPAVGGAPMILPLTDMQRNEALTAWTVLAAFAGDAPVSSVHAQLGNKAKLWREAVRSLAQYRPEAAARASEAFAAAFPDIPAPGIIAADSLIALGQFDEAEGKIRDLEIRWPDDPAVARLRRRLDQRPLASPKE